MIRHRRTAWLVAAVLAVLLVPLTASAQTPVPIGRADALVADAFGIEVDGDAVGLDPAQIDRNPFVRVEMPPQLETARAALADLGPIDGDGTLIRAVEIETVTAGGDLDEGRASAVAGVVGVELLGGSIGGLLGAPALIDAEAIRAVSTSTCGPEYPTLEEASAGTTFTGGSILGQPVPENPGPNTEIAVELPGLGGFVAVLNEVIPDSSGVGYTVRGLHLYPAEGATQGAAGVELILAEAHSSVVCADGAGPTGENPLLAEYEIRLDKQLVGDGGSAVAGETVTYELTVTNQSDAACTVTELVDTLPEGFAYVADSQTGFLDSAESATQNGPDVLFDFGGGLAVEPMSTVTGTFDARLADDLPPRTYYDDAQLRSTCGSARTGPTAPVSVTPSDLGAQCVPEDLGTGSGTADLGRINGLGRVDTAIRVSGCLFPEGADVVVLGRADLYADSLSGGPLASVRNGPILYTPTDSLDPATAAEIERLDPQAVILLGGVAALTPAVERAAGEFAPTERYGGFDRFDTATRIADALVTAGAARNGVAFITDGGGGPAETRGWPDAISAAPLAGFRGDPILLVSNTDIPAITDAQLDDMGITETLIIGGTAAVGPGVETSLRDGGHGPERLGGANRFDTSAMVYDRSVADGLDPGVLILATGLGWPDPLSAGPTASRLGISFLLVDGADLDASSESRAVIERQADVIDVVRFIGGPATISRDVEVQVAGILGAQPSPEVVGPSASG